MTTKEHEEMVFGCLLAIAVVLGVIILFVVI